MIVTDLSREFHPVPKPKDAKKNVKETSKSGSKNVMKKKSSKLAKLEKQRDKDIVKSGKCEFCGRECKRLDPHEVYGGSNRQRSIKHKFIKLICRECHSNEKIIAQLRKDVQREFEKNASREAFIEIIGKSYLKGE